MKCPQCGNKHMVCTQTLANGKIEVWYCPDCGFETRKLAKYESLEAELLQTEDHRFFG